MTRDADSWAPPARMSFHVGLFLAVNAIEDGYAVIDGPDCNFRKAQWVHLKHDLNATLLDPGGRHRVINTLMDDEHVITNRGEALALRLEQLGAIARSGVALLCSMPHVMILGTQYDKVLRDVADKVSIPVFEVPSRSLEGDWVDGYAEAMLAIARSMDVRNASPRAGHVAVIGNLMPRNEEDGRADVAALRGLLEGIGLTVTSVWLDGGPYQELLAARDAEALIALPLGVPAAQALARRTGQRVIEAPVPFGPGRTRRFLRAVAREMGVLDVLTPFVDTSLRRVIPRIHRAIPAVFQDRRVAFSAPPMYWGGMLDVCAELGMELVHLSANGGAALHTEDLAAEFGPLPPVLVPYQFDSLGRELEAIHAARPVDLAIGDTRACQRLSWTMPVMEFGFPSHFDHALHPRPTLGFEGWGCFLDRVAHALWAQRWGRFTHARHADG